MKRRQILNAAGAGTLLTGAPLVLRAQNAYRAEYKMSTVVPPAFAWLTSASSADAAPIGVNALVPSILKSCVVTRAQCRIF